MQRSSKIFVAKCVAIFSVVPIMIMAHSAGPDAGLTGAPGENTCWQSGCHRSTVALNGGGGSIQLTASTGTTYVPGQKVTFTVTGNDSAARVWGFEASMRDSANKGVGTFTPGTGQTVICADTSIRKAPGCTALPEFIEHSQHPLSSNTWSFDWTAPSQSSGDITLYMAVNAANGNGAETGDHIYTTSLKLSPASPNPNAPTIATIQNGATNVPGSAGEAGSWVAIVGTNLTSGTGTWDGPPSAIGADGVLPTNLGGTKVTIGGKDAAIYYYSPTQINVQVPDVGGTGDFPVVVTTANGTAQATMTVKSEAPGFFMFDAANRKYIAALTFDNKYLGDNLYPTLPFRPARPGEVVQLFGTGFGATNPAVPAGKVFSGAANLANTPTATIGGQPAVVQFAGLVSGAGLYQVNLIVPQSLADGDHKVVVTVNGVSTQDNAFITVKH